MCIAAMLVCTNQIYITCKVKRVFSVMATTYMYIIITLSLLSPNRKQAFLAQRKVLTTSQVW